MKRLPILLISVVIFISSCGKDPESEPELPQNARFSVLGDSYSAFEGYVDPDSNSVYSEYPDIGVTQPEQMWWYRIANEAGWTMEKNNSYSGSLICNFNYHDYYGPYSFIRRMDNLGHPDVIFVFGATNDTYAGVPLGDYVYDDWTEEQLCSFRPALAYLLENLKKLYPYAKLYFLVDMDLCSGGVPTDVRDVFIESIHQVSNHYNVKCIDLYNIYKTNWHPNESGQRKIARQILEVVKP